MSKTLEELIREFDLKHPTTTIGHHHFIRERNIRKWLKKAYELGCDDGKEVYSKASELSRQRGYDNGVKDGMKGRLFSQVKITEEVNVPKEIHDKIFQAGRDSMKDEIESKLPEKMNENPDWEQLYANHRKIGFNSCLKQVEDIIKSL